MEFFLPVKLGIKTKWESFLFEKIPIRHLRNLDSRNASSYCYYGWFTMSGSPRTFLPGIFQSEILRLLPSRSPVLKLYLVSLYSCRANFLQSGSVSAVPLAGFCFHISKSKNGPFISYLINQIYYPYIRECNFLDYVL